MKCILCTLLCTYTYKMYIAWKVASNSPKIFYPPSPQSFYAQDGWEKTSYPRISAEGSSGNMRCKLLQKRSTGKTECSKHLQHITIEKDNLSELNRCIFQISLKYLKLVIPKKQLYWYYAVLTFTSNYMTPPLPQNKNFWPPPPPLATTFLKLLTP